MALKVRRNRAPRPPAPCAVSECMYLLAGTWTANIVWSLRAGPRRFGELQRDLPGVSAKVLSARLKQMEKIGSVARTPRATRPPSVEYSLTELGAELIPALDSIVSVGHRLKQRRDAVAMQDERDEVAE